MCWYLVHIGTEYLWLYETISYSISNSVVCFGLYHVEIYCDQLDCIYSTAWYSAGTRNSAVIELVCTSINIQCMTLLQTHTFITHWFQMQMIEAEIEETELFHDLLHGIMVQYSVEVEKFYQLIHYHQHSQFLFGWKKHIILEVNKLFLLNGI